MARKHLILGIFFLFFGIEAHSWGQSGHRVVGWIAEQHLSKKARKNIKKLMGHESLAIASTWMDEIKSDRAYDHTHDWHWVTIPDGMRYEDTEKNPKGDLIESTERIIAALKNGGLSQKEELEYLRMLVHLVGDVHQPLHVGRGDDKGGNDVKVRWFWNNSNLHRVWDTGIIEGQNFSYTELAKSINHATPDQVKAIQANTFRDWAYEAMNYRGQIYDLPEDGNINYEYSYKNWPIVKEQLLKGGIRLAGILNEIYG